MGDSSMMLDNELDHLKEELRQKEQVYIDKLTALEAAEEKHREDLEAILMQNKLEATKASLYSHLEEKQREILLIKDIKVRLRI